MEKTEKEKKPKKINKAETIRIAKFALFSVSAGLVQLGSFTLLNELTHLPYWPSYLISLVLSVVWNFTFNRKFTFKSANNIPVAMLKTFAYYCVFTPLSTILGHYLADTCGWNEYLVEGINMALNFSTEFLYQRFFVFGKSMNTNNIAKKEQEKSAADNAADQNADNEENTATDNDENKNGTDGNSDKGDSDTNSKTA